MPGRERDYVANDYRFGYNGMEKDNAVKGNGNSYTTEFRQYDPRLGRWLSLDPLMHEFPWMSPYVAFNNNPIFFIDPLGLEGEPGDGDPRIYYNPNGSVGNVIVLVPNSVTGRGEFANNIYRSVTRNKLMKHSTFDIILASNIELANELMDEYLMRTGINQLRTLVYNDHGDPIGIRVYLRGFKNPETGENRPVENYVNAKNIYGHGAPSSVYAASELIALLSKVGNSGSIVMAVCFSGYNTDIGEAILNQPTINDVNLYLNGDLTTMKHTPNHNGPFEGRLSGIFLIEDENFDVGWRLFNKNSSVSIPQATITNKNVGNIGVNADGTIKTNPDFQPKGKFPSENEDGDR